MTYTTTAQASELENLIHGCVRNERAAQEQVYRLFYGRMMALVRQYIDQTEVAEEIVNNGFLRAFQKVALYNFQGSFEGWVRKIVFRAVCDYVKTADKPGTQIALTETHEYVSREDASRLEYEELLKMVQQLPLATRTVFNMYVLEGFNHREIHEAIGISEGTSKWHLSEARRLLRERIESLELHLKR